MTVSFDEVLGFYKNPILKMPHPHQILKKIDFFHQNILNDLNIFEIQVADEASPKANLS